MNETKAKYIPKAKQPFPNEIGNTFISHCRQQQQTTVLQHHTYKAIKHRITK